MKIHPEEVEFAQQYTRYLHRRELPFQGLTQEQSQAVIARGRALYQWFKAHPLLHNTISLGVISLLLVGDALVLLGLPGLLLGPGPTYSLGIFIGSALIIGIVHGWLVYSLVVYSLHEGAAHHLIFRPIGPVTKWLDRMAGNLCRLGAADPVHYTRHHLSHHAHFGTSEDGEFLNFVVPRRYWLCFIPFAMFLNFSDFIAHRPLSFTRSRLLSAAVALSYNGAYFYFMTRLWGPLFAFLVLVVVGPHVAFLLDRVRQFSEHNLMPIENRDGARSFGPGLWGLLIGGGPWGQPCHWMHHLIPTVPWYQQIMLHFHVASILTPRQRRQYLLQPVIGYPRLLWRLWTEPNRFVQGLETGGPGRGRRGDGGTGRRGDGEKRRR